MVAVDWQSPTVHDFGDIAKQETSICYFVFRNNQPFPIVIDNIRTTCGGTAPDWTPFPIQPQALDSIRIEFDAVEAGYFKKHIKVYFSHQRKAEHLYIEGYVLD
ncbi:MAG TPA: DUF1573 domain-containing protein [Saprospiraceae bacterium]|nr:DUF1573 domain-containing protein [Saprospiraceae bacterium]